MQAQGLAQKQSGSFATTSIRETRTISVATASGYDKDPGVHSIEGLDSA